MKKIPINQVISFAILLFLLGIRCFTGNDLCVAVSCVNYIGMAVSFLNNWIVVLNNSKRDRNCNISTAFFVIALFIFTIVGCYGVFVVGMSEKTNDIVTLLALLFCVCNTIFEKLLGNIFSLSVKGK